MSEEGKTQETAHAKKSGSDTPGQEEPNQPNINFSQESPLEKESDSIDLREEVEKWKNSFIYLKAEFDNYKKQVLKERSDLIKYGSERLILSLLDVMDVFDRALATEVNSETLDAFVKGVQLTSDEFRNTLHRFGVSGNDPMGERFDPSRHEALSSEETTEVPEGHISRVYRRAYKLHERTIRPAQVVVAKEPSQEKEKESEG